MKDLPDAVRLPQGQDAIAPVTIFDPQGQVVRVVEAAEFRRTHQALAASRFPAMIRHPRGGKGATS